LPGNTAVIFLHLMENSGPCFRYMLLM
jgi:hypothetical protein